jgi:hypothetical protein
LQKRKITSIGDWETIIGEQTYWFWVNFYLSWTKPQIFFSCQTFFWKYLHLRKPDSTITSIGIDHNMAIS